MTDVTTVTTWCYVSHCLKPLRLLYHHAISCAIDKIVKLTNPNALSHN